jgi:hypothetical protein
MAPSLSMNDQARLEAQAAVAELVTRRRLEGDESDAKVAAVAPPVNNDEEEEEEEKKNGMSSLMGMAMSMLGGQKGGDTANAATALMNHL